GELVTREELRSSLWPTDTFVDFNHGLNAAVNKLRETLSDSAEDPRYIETLPRRGYRLIANVEWLEARPGWEESSAKEKEEVTHEVVPQAAPTASEPDVVPTFLNHACLEAPKQRRFLRYVVALASLVALYVIAHVVVRTINQHTSAANRSPVEHT